MIGTDGVVEFIRKQELVIWNLGELIKNLTYRLPQYRGTGKEVAIYETVEEILNQIEKTSHAKGPEGEEYPVWDNREKLLKKLQNLLRW